MDIGVCLRWYKRQDVQEAICKAAAFREVGVRYQDKGFGKRPDMIVYPKDVIEFAKKGTSSFHVSEEHWSNPLAISTNLTPKQMDEIRTGWDFVLDIDCPIWKFSKRITKLSVDILKGYGIKSVYVKFSGNKGFHIGVPFDSFPKTLNGEPLEKLFPDAPKTIANYIVSLMRPRLMATMTNEDKQEIATFLGKPVEQVFISACSSCNHEYTPKDVNHFVCNSCGKSMDSEKPYLICPKCGKIMDKQHVEKVCPRCNSKEPPEISFDLSAILQIDTVLISSRHMYRCIYSLHEKSGLASIPVEIDNIESFDKQLAQPDNVNVKFDWLEQSVDGEASQLLIDSYDFASREMKRGDFENKPNREFILPDTPIDSEQFPPCINNILKGLEDGRKRSMFILYNFLKNMAWDYDQIEKFMLDWNERNEPPIRVNLLKAHLMAHKRDKNIRLPPNCNHDGYYKDLRICTPDGICQRIKNPANYHRFRKKSKAKKKPGKSEQSDVSS